MNIRAVSSVVERLPYKQVVIGSNPIPPMYLKFKIGLYIFMWLEGDYLLTIFIIGLIV